MTTSAQKRSPDFQEKLAAAVASHSPRRKYLIGVSGGCDSLSLLHALHALGYHHLIVCHIDHALRGRHSTADRALVQRRAKKLGYIFETTRVSTRETAAAKKQSIELAARDLRHAFFATCARRHRCPRLFLAHHADDQVETILFNFLRGTGAAGLGGMQPASKNGGLEILRPLLQIIRREISAYAKAEKIAFRTDASNQSHSHTRNRLRHEALPALRKSVAACDTAILRAAEILRDEEAWMDSLVPPASEKLSCRELRAQPAALRRRVVLRWLRKGGVPEAGFAETERTLSLLDPATGPAKVSLPGNFHARRRSGEIFLEPA